MAKKPTKAEARHASAMELVNRSERSGDAKSGRKASGRGKGSGGVAGGGAPRPKKKGGGSGGILATTWAYLKALVLWSVLGAGLGVATTGAILYRGALERVDARMKGPVYTVPGRVWSGPIEVWPGLVLSADTLAADLAAAGYARVDKVEKPGDFQASRDAVLVKVRDDSGPGWSVKAADVLVTFKDGRVATTSPTRRARFAPVLLATVRGADNENRSPVPLQRIPEHVRHAVLAMEDARFYEHEGIDPLGIARAMWMNLRKQAWEQGGSTLTQQLAKNVFLTGERTADRKLREALLSLALERRLTKDEILQLYLNEIYLGQAGTSALCGVDAAARAWFGKPVERVDVAEGAVLAGVIASPNKWSPLRHPEEARRRRDAVLDRMAEVGWLSAADAQAQKGEELVLNPSSTARQAPWAVDLAVEAVEEATSAGSVARDGLEVHTTISPTLQHLAERALSEGMAEVLAGNPKLAKVQAAVAVVRASDGAVVAMVGGRDYATSSYNRVVNARRQVGSTVKALTMLVGFETDAALSPATRFTDSPISRVHDGKTWTPANYDGSFLGPVSLRHAVAVSRNIPAVLLAEHIGLGTLESRLHGLGLGGATDYPSVALGGFGATPLELARAYTVFAGADTVGPPILTRAALTADGDEAWRAPEPAETARYGAVSRWLARDVLRSVMTDGTGKKAAKYGVGPGAAGKSGTTDGYVDAWFAGVTGPYAVVVWVGYDQNQPVGLTGSAAALPTWARFVAWTGLSADNPAMPAGIVRAEVCVDTDRPPCPGCSATRTELFRAGQVPAAECGIQPALGRPMDFLKKLFGRSDPEAPPAEPVEEDGAPVRIRPRDRDRLGPGGTPIPE